jgi:aconitate hydratase
MLCPARTSGKRPCGLFDQIQEPPHHCPSIPPTRRQQQRGARQGCPFETPVNHAIHLHPLQRGRNNGDPQTRRDKIERRDDFAPGRIAYVAPPRDGRDIVLAIDPNSGRQQRLDPWPAWDGQDFPDMKVLVKTKGKTTTDHISPAGPWLRYRGHLDRFSDNMFMGATNAFTGAAGIGKNLLTGEHGRPFAETARAYKAAGIKWVVVGDANYGEGSSREHAALSPRLLGGVAVIARGFARIHETNLKKQGLLALTFQNQADYERIREGDRISLIGLAHLAPGVPVECLIKHDDGSVETLALSHSFSADQLKWFVAGGALNLVGR